MKYCVPYFKTFKYMTEVDEVIVPYERRDVEFINSLTSKEKLITNTIIVDIKDMYEFKDHDCLKVFEALKNNYPEVSFKLRFREHNKDFNEFYNKIKELEIPFFFMDFVRSWDMFHGLIKLGVSDLYIVEELGFELKVLGQIARASSISIRVFANVCQSSWSESDSLKSFFIRPEDVSIYDQYVDVLEFFGEKQNQQEVMFKVYAKDKKWFGPLKEIIVGLDSEIDSRSILPNFGLIRAGCKKRCVKGEPGYIPCKICDRMASISASLLEKGHYFKY